MSTNGIAATILALSLTQVSNCDDWCNPKEAKVHCIDIRDHGCLNQSNCITCNEAKKNNPDLNCADGPCPNGIAWAGFNRLSAVANGASLSLVPTPFDAAFGGDLWTAGPAGLVCMPPMCDCPHLTASAVATITVVRQDGTIEVLTPANVAEVRIDIRALRMTDEQAGEWSKVMAGEQGSAR